MTSTPADGHRLKICLTSSEAVPYSKTGGLADVAGALPRALSELGHDVILVVPNHYDSRASQSRSVDLKETGLSVTVPIHGRSMTAQILEGTLPDSSCRVLLIDQPVYFDRPGLYLNHGVDYPDNCERFAFFCRATLQLLDTINFAPDVIHCNDWQTGLIPALVALERHEYSTLRHTATVYTIHNLAFQGVFWKWDIPLTGLDWVHFNWEQLESHNQLNLMKSGIVFSNRITTVSPTYAHEIQTQEFGCGMEELLGHRSQHLTGILNGIDAEEWNPATDQFLPENFDINSFKTGKQTCRIELQQRLNLPTQTNGPVIGMVSRMTDQKGFDLLTEIADRLPNLNAQFVFLGTGDAQYESALQRLNEFPNIAATIGFNNKLAHLIEAGSDIFLMPSRYEPCGLNQMYSLAYGTLPIVRRTGGLADSVVDSSEHNVANQTANGFVFDKYSSAELLATIERAISTFENQDQWHQLMETGMRRDWSWKSSAEKYVNVYNAACEDATVMQGQ